MVLRGLGLGLLSSLMLHRWHGKYGTEPLKIVFRQNRPVALLRGLIHIIPVAAALWLIILNWITYYVGSSTYDQIYYQVGAKTLEIMVQASLASIALAYVRHELIRGKGLPFGALFSSLQVSQVSYLWSMEFWGSIASKSLSIYRKLSMLVAITIIFVLAAAAGPSAAILLIPRNDFWPAGSTHIWINATKDEIWPNKLVLKSSSI